MKPRFYLANQTSQAIKGLELQRYIEARVCIELVNPFFDRSGNPTKEMRNILHGEKNPVNRYEVTARDINLVKECDGIVAYLSKNELCIGTAWEMAVASTLYGRPVYVIDEVRDYDVSKHPFLEHHGIEVFPGRDKFIEFALSSWGAKTEEINVR